MDSQLTIRVPKETARRMTDIARRRGIKKSELAREAISKLLDEEERLGEVSPYKLVKSLLGSVSSGLPDLGSRHREHLLERLKKHA